MSVSVVINTLNEEANIERAIKSVKKWADEIVVVDMESTDQTVKIAKRLGSKVFSHKSTHYVEPARNFAIEKAKGEWIFILDADEEATSSLCERLTQIKNADDADFVRIPRKNIIFGKWMKHSRWWPDYNIRFFKKGNVTWESEIHSVPVTTGRGVNLPAEENFALVHHHYDSVEQYIERLNRYTTIQANELFKRDRAFKYSDFIQKPTGEFLSRYFAGQGYKDGVHGLIVSLLQSLSELCVYAKLWGLHGFKEQPVSLGEVAREIKNSQKETNYWIANSRVNEGAGLAQKIRRKLKV